jgi:hypothetical protein
MPIVSGCMAAAVIAVVDVGRAGAVWWQFSAWVAIALHTLVWQVMAAHASNSNSPCWQLCSNSNDTSRCSSKFRDDHSLKYPVQ